MGKIRAVDDNQRVRLRGNDRLRGLPDTSKDQRQLAWNRRSADDGKIGGVEGAFKPMTLHRPAAYPSERAVRTKGAQRSHQGAAEHVAGFLHGNKEELELRAHCALPLTPPTNPFPLSAAAAPAAGSATTAAAAATAIPAGPARAPPSTGRGPIGGRSNRRS